MRKWHRTIYTHQPPPQKKQEIASAGKDVEKEEHLYTASGNINWWDHYGKQSWKFVKKLKIKQP